MATLDLDAFAHVEPIDFRVRLLRLDLHPLPVVAATNHGAGLDPATLRRFVFKLRRKPLGQSTPPPPARASSVSLSRHASARSRG